MKKVRTRSRAAEAVVVAFDMCSSSEIIETLTAAGGVGRLQMLFVALERLLIKTQRSLAFEPYKFTGDGWILLFPADVDGAALLKFMRELSAFYRAQFAKIVEPHLAHRPAVVGLTFGVDKGPLHAVKLCGQSEYVGHALHMACRLQAAVRINGRAPAYRALASERVFDDYFREMSADSGVVVRRTLRALGNGKRLACRQIELGG